MRHSALLSAMAAALAACACAMMPQPPTHLSGPWGGPRISLMLQGGLGTIEYDCASGTIDTPVIPAPDGRFTASGTHRPGQGGPVRVGQVFTSHPATYSGRVKGDRMTLTGRLEDGTPLGPFTLSRGSAGELLRCL